MTVTEERPTLWGSMPGWGIAADLTPPELINSRKMKVLRRQLAAGGALLLVLCAGGYFLAARENSAAMDDLAIVQNQTVQLQGVSRSFSDVVSIQGSVRQIENQIAQLMTADVDLVGLLGELQGNLPSTMTITQEAITISTAGVAGADGATDGSSALDTSGATRIGTVTLSGTGQTLDDVPDYVDRLRTVTGLVDITPVSNVSSDTGTAYNITIGLTDALLSHRFDLGTG